MRYFKPDPSKLDLKNVPKLKKNHRKDIGGKWDEMGGLQFDFLVEMGLKPHHVLLDLGCGSLRGGVHFINYLNKGNYLGLEQIEELVQSGIFKELTIEKYEVKNPEFVISSEFEFEKFSKKPDYVMVQSVFTHLKKEEINDCLEKLSKYVKKDTKIYVTYFPRKRFFGFHKIPFIKKKHGIKDRHLCFSYTKKDMINLGKSNSFNTNYIGKWGHPRSQEMVEYSLE